MSARRSSSAGPANEALASASAAARACSEPTPQKLKDLVTEVINDKFVQGQLDNSHLTLHDLAMIAEQADRCKKIVAGQFSFSVCTDDKCLMEKRDLLLDVNVE